MLSTIGLHDEAPIKRLGTDVGRMARDLNVLFKIANTINSLRSLESFQSQLLQLIGEVIPADFGAILIIRHVDEEPNSIVTWHRQAVEPSQPNVHREIVLRALWERSAVLADFSSPSRGTERVLCVPLIALQNALGVIYLATFNDARGFPEDNVHLLKAIAGIASVTLENILILESLRDENRRLREELVPEYLMIGESKPFLHLTELIQKVAKGDSTVLVHGDSGTGKEMVAVAIHRSSARAEGPFAAINCAAIPETLLESELFGYEKGAFTGAVASKRGKFDLARGGTLFLDEIGELTPALQAKLLRVLQTRAFERLGGTQLIKLCARVIAATNKDLELAIKKGEFRRDLFYRLNVVSIAVPPLRERREDIALLAIYFATKYAQRCTSRRFKGISPEARLMLTDYSWPGNVRELENAIEHAIVMGSADVILPEDLPEALLEWHSSVRREAKYYDSINQLKRKLILDAMEEAQGRYPEAAKLLGIHPNYLHRLVRNLDVASDISQGTNGPSRNEE
jgi:transcriptional regulator with GAF, ATPase, and Fis domain